jgi:Bacterial type III secretion protein (HrpB1_HrpK)
MSDIQSEDNEDAGKPVPGSVYRTLLQFALLGTELGESAAAKQISQILRDLRPDLPQASIVLAMTDFFANQSGSGISELQETLQHFPDSQLTKAMLGVCLQVAGQSGWQSILESVIEDGRDEYAIGLACSILGRSPSAAAVESTEVERMTAAPANAMWA